MNHSKWNVKLKIIWNYFLACLIAVIVMIPFLWMLSTSLKSKGALMQIPIEWIPQNPTLDSYRMVFSRFPFLRAILNSLFITCSYTVVTILSASMAAFAFTKIQFPYGNTVFKLYLASMMIPTQVTALGFVKLVTGMGLMDSFIPLIVPTIASPVTYFYMKQYMESSLPLSLIEAARIDGSGEFRTFNHIVLPLMKPAIAVQAIFSFVSSWNNYFTPALILHENNKKTLPILLAQLRSADFLKFDMGKVYMMITFSILPVIVVYLILSKHIVGGVAMGSVKG